VEVVENKRKSLQVSCSMQEVLDLNHSDCFLIINTVVEEILLLKEEEILN
jgi:hypothetical protein